MIASADPWLDVWTLNLAGALSTDHLIRMSGVLSQAERLQAERFRQPQRRAQAIAARALLRYGLSLRDNHRPATWCIDADERGRPKLIPTASDIDFNIAHTSGMVVCALSSGFPVGIDVEHIGRARDMADIADRFLSADEHRTWRAKAPQDADAFLAQLWTLKEARAKATGLGLQIDFTRISFVLEDNGEIRLRDDPSWTFSSRVSDSGHVISTAWKAAVPVRPDVRDGAQLLGL